MAHKKLIRFKELATFPNVFQYPENKKGKWADFFAKGPKDSFWSIPSGMNKNPITLELACGKGEYTVGLGEMFPDRNFIGVDLKGNRIWVGAKKALQNKLTNVAFLRTQIDQITEYFAEDEIAEIWITFPDPQLRISKVKKRLTHPKFLRLYQQFLMPGGLIHLKTDSPDLYHFTKLVIEMYNCKIHKDIVDVHKEDSISPELNIKTYYETLDIAQSNRVHYLCFSLPGKIENKEKDEELKQILKDNERTD